MRRTPVMLAALALAGAAAPAALLAHPGKADDHPAHHPKHAKSTLNLLRACVVADATQTGVDLKVLGGNHHMRKALAGATTFTATLDDTTLIRLVGRARLAPAGTTPRLLPKIGTWDDLDAADLVTVRYRVPRGTALADLGPAWRITDHGPAKRCALAPTVPTAPTAPATGTPTS